MDNSVTRIAGRGRLMVGHTLSLDDPAAPILVPADTITAPGGQPLVVDAVCRGCVARSRLGRLGDDTLLLIEHDEDCPGYRELAQRQGAA